MGELPSHGEELPKEESKRETGVSRFVGFSSEEEREVLKKAKNLFENQGDKKILENELRLFEREKTPEEIEMINDILSNMPEFVKKYGGDFPPITTDHIHILDNRKLPEEIREKANQEGGGHFSAMQFAYIFDDENSLKNAHKIVHELIHFSAFQSFEKISTEEKSGVAIRRTGFEIHNNTGDKKEVYFTDLNEAITEELTKRFDKEYFASISHLAGQVKERQEFIDKHKGGKQGDIFFKETKQLETGEWQTTILPYAYVEHRRQLREIVKTIYEKNKKEFASREEVFDIFARSAMTGKILESARLMEKTYGKGAFRRGGEKTKRK